MSRLAPRSGSFWALLLSVVVSATAVSAALDIYWTVTDRLPPATSRLVSIWDARTTGDGRVLEARQIETIATLSDLFESVVSFGVVERVLVGANGIRHSVRGVVAGAGLPDISGQGVLTADRVSKAPSASSRPIELTVTVSLLEELQTRIGERTHIDGAEAIITKVVATGAAFPTPAARFWLLPSESEEAGRDQRQQTFFEAVARLRPGIRPDAARRAIEQRLSEPPGGIGLEMFGQDQRRTTMPALRAMLSAALALFVVGTLVAVSVAFTRVVEREHDLHVMAALGAEPRHITMVVLRDIGLTGVLALPAILAGVAATKLVLLESAVHLAPLDVTATFGTRTLLTAVLVSGVMVLIVGLVVGGRGAIVAAGRLSGSRWAGQRLTTILVVQGAVVALLGTTAVMQARAAVFATSPHVLGFKTMNLSVIPVRLPSTDVLMPNAAQRFMETATHMSSRGQAAIVSHLPLSGHDRSMSIRVPGTDQTSYIPAGMRLVSPDFFSLVGAQVVAGDLTLVAERRTLVINTVLAEAAFGPGQAAVGRSLVLGGRFGPEWEVAAVVAPFRHRGVFDAARPEAFALYPASDSFGEPIRSRQLTSAFVLYDARSVEPEALFRDLAGSLPGFAVATPQPFDRYALAAAGPRPLMAASAGLLAASALGLMGVGLFGVMNTVMHRRAVELAIRCALGATPLGNAIASLRPILVALTVGIIVGGAATALGLGVTEAFVPFPPDFDVRRSAAAAFFLTAAGAYLGTVLAMLAPLSLTWRVNLVTTLRRGADR